MKFRTDENLPLLLFFVEDDYKNRKNNRGLYFEKGRFNSIANGASAIISGWPNYLNTCWLTALICGVTLFILMMMLSITMSNFYVRPIPKCITDLRQNETNNRTEIIHLVHGPNNWTQNELESLENVAKWSETYRINLILINSEQEQQTRRDFVFMKNQTDKFVMTSTTTIATNNENIPLDIKQLFMALFRLNQTNTTTTTTKELKKIEDVVKNYRNIAVQRFDYFDYILNKSPFSYNKWRLMSDSLKMFAIRILQLWQFGGLSFDLQLLLNTTTIIDRNFVLKRFENLSNDAVLIDRNGKILGSKVACHVFFGELLLQIQTATEQTTIEEIMGKVLKIFCNRNNRFRKKYCKFVDG